MLTKASSLRPTGNIFQYCKCSLNKCSNVSTWTPLAVKFNTKPESESAFSFMKQYTGLFGIPSLITAEGLYALKERASETTEQLLNEVNNPNRPRKVVQIFDDLSDELCKVADLAEFLRMMHPAQNYCQIAEEICITMSGLVEKLNTNKTLYSNLKSVAENGDQYPLTDTEKHIARLFLFDFEQCGIHLPEEDRKHVVYYNDCILQLGQAFMSNAASPRIVSKTSVPEALTSFFQYDKDNILVNGFSDLPTDVAREVAYRLYLMPDEKQEKLLDEILHFRQKLANTCGFNTYSDRALKSSTADNPQFVSQFLSNLNEELRERTNADVNLLKNIKRKDTDQELSMWDVSNMTSKGKQEWLKASINDYCPYFSLGACMEGLNQLFQKLFKISLINEEMNPGESWADDIYKLAVTHETEGLLGYIYCDFYDRTHKPRQDCHFTIRGGRRLSDGTYQNPIVVVVLNISPPSWSKPSLLTPQMVENLFHEMGHAIHSMLGRTEYQHVTGTRCVTDFAEVPSVLMEFFANDKRVLKSFARHYKTKEPMPRDMMDRLCSSRHMFSSMELQTQVFYSALDHAYHSKPLNFGDTSKVLKEIQTEYYPLPYVEGTAWQLRFSHLVGYGAKYYSYLVSKAIAASTWQKYFKKDPFDSSSGEKYRHECLAHGGAKPPRLLVKDFLDEEVTPQNLTSSLISDIDEYYRKT